MISAGWGRGYGLVQELARDEWIYTGCTQDKTCTCVCTPKLAQAGKMRLTIEQSAVVLETIAR